MWLSNTSDVDISGYFRALFELHILLDRSSFKVASFAFFLYLIMKTVDTDSQTKSNSDFCIMSVSSFYNDMANLFSSLIFCCHLPCFGCSYLLCLLWEVLNTIFPDQKISTYLRKVCILMKIFGPFSKFLWGWLLWWIYINFPGRITENCSMEKFSQALYTAKKLMSLKAVGRKEQILSRYILWNY